MVTYAFPGRSARLMTIEKAAICRKAKEERQDHLEQMHIDYQRDDFDATYMIEGFVEIYEAIFKIS